MCGFVGYWKNSEYFDRSVIEKMTDQIQHRGPDDAGYWLDERVGLALGHRRLSILELSTAGNQPMSSPCGRFFLVFNGEIYNHVILRQKLEEQGNRIRWRGCSDTETLLMCFSAWGLKKTLHEIVGMFAFALWDMKERKLLLARDRLGEKPVYYGWHGKTFIFGSELKALKAHPDFHAEVDRDSLALFLRHNCIPAPYSIYKNTYKLRPGTYLVLSTNEKKPSGGGQIETYWRFDDIVFQGLNNQFDGTADEAVDSVEQQLLRTVQLQMLSDVPLGAFLSGGIDSSTIVALMQTLSDRPVKTFTIGFKEDGFDEAVHARAIAKHLRTDHTELYLGPEDMLSVVPRLPTIYCEPFSDSSQIPTFLVSKLAHQHVKVVLSGDGGDELFGGYNRHHRACNVWRRAQMLPRYARRGIACGIEAFSPAQWDKLYGCAEKLIPKSMRIAAAGNKLHKLAGVLESKDEKAFYRRLTSHWNEPTAVALNSREPITLFTDTLNYPAKDSIEHWMMAMDTQTYLPDDILVKIDRAAMANNLETRVPFLDHRVVELAWRMPLSYKIRQGQSKWLLRRVISRYIPNSLMDRPKQGFGSPIASWLRGPLRDWAEELLDEKRLLGEGYFDPAPIRNLWNDHLKGKRNWQYHLWDVLMFQAWHEMN